MTFCHQSFIISFLICRLVPCLVFHQRDLVEFDMYKEGHRVQRCRSSSVLITIKKGGAPQFSDTGTQKCRWFREAQWKSIPPSGTPRSRENPSKQAAQARNVTLPWTAGPHHWGRATCRVAVQAEHSFEGTSWSSGSAQQHLQPLPLAWPGDTLQPSHCLLHIPALPRKEQLFLQTPARIHSGKMMLEA